MNVMFVANKYFGTNVIIEKRYLGPMKQSNEFDSSLCK